MVLHTWGSNMSYHPHVHAIVPGGGITLRGKWKEGPGKGKFLFPVKAMSKVFRGKFIAELTTWMRNQGMDDNDILIKSLYDKPWVVYAKPPFGGTQGVIRYLARYTHKLAITHHRIISYDARKVTFRYKNYRHSNYDKIMTLTTWEFIHRYILHFLPKSFPRIRHYGILSSVWKKRVFPEVKTTKTDWQQVWKDKGLDVLKCPHCKLGMLIFVGTLEPVRGPPFYYKSKSKSR